MFLYVHFVFVFVSFRFVFFFPPEVVVVIEETYIHTDRSLTFILPPVKYEYMHTGMAPPACESLESFVVEKKKNITLRLMLGGIRLPT